MIYPSNFELKTGFSRIRESLKNYCLSPLGIKEVEEMEFSQSFDVITHNIELTEEFRQILLFGENIPLDHYIDATRFFKKAAVEGAFLELEEVNDLKKSLETIRLLVSFVKNLEYEKFPRLRNLAGPVKQFPAILDKINAILTRHGKVKDNASPELAAIRSSMHQLSSEVSKRMQRLLKQAQSEGWVEKDTTISMRNGRPVIPVNASDKRKLKGFIHDESSTGKTAFVEPSEVFEANNKIRELEYAEHREIVKILTNFTIFLRPYLPELTEAYTFLGQVDFNHAKAKYALQTNAVLPRVFDEQIIRWKDAFHPLLYLTLRAASRDIVPMSLELIPEERILVISGPNAGGKSVCLQTVALLQYMLQCGMLVSGSENSEYGIFQNIMLDIGDEQSIENDLSTYSSHLVNMKAFIKNCNEKTLILIDEFGAGTEPMLGGAVAESLLQGMNEKLTFGVITTHYTNLKHFAASQHGIINGAMLFDIQKLEPLYKLQVGRPGSSFAFEIARKIGLPEEILKNASEKVGKEHIDFDKHLKDVLRDKRYWEKKRENIRRSNKKLEQTLGRYEKELADIKALQKETLRKAKTEAEQLLADVNSKIENTIRIIKESQADKEKTREARQSLEALKATVKKDEFAESGPIDGKMARIREKQNRKKNVKKTELPTREENTREQPLKIGDKVRLTGQQSAGEVMELSGKNISVAFGNMITTVKEDKLEKISSNEYKNSQKENRIKVSAGFQSDLSERKLNFKPRLDVRGNRTEDALKLVENFMDDAALTNSSEVRILHGKGDGILRQFIRGYLRGLDFVHACKDEHVQYGGSGITIVELK